MNIEASEQNVYWSKSTIHGLGVFARRLILAGCLVELCPIIVVPKEQIATLDNTLIYNYYYEWQSGSAAVALGLGSLYNHSFAPNATYELDEKSNTIVIRAIADIQAQEEVTFNYTGAGTDPSLLWFDISSQTATQSQMGSALGKYP